MTAHPTEGTRLASRPRWKARLHWLGVAALGACTGALVARLAGELWPLAWTARLPASLFCWTLAPLSWLAFTLAGALALPSVVRLLRPGAGPGDWLCLWPLALGALYLVQPLRLPLWGLAALAGGLGGTVWLCRRARLKSQTDWGPSWLGDVLVLLLALALYVGTLAPSVLPGDSGEFQLVAPTLGIPHPTGYPLYLLLGKLISLLPLGSVAYRLNLLSALAAAGAVWATYRAGRALGLRRPAAMLGAGLLAVSSTFWSQATIAEKYTLNAFFVAATLWLGLEWRRAHLAGKSRDSRRWLSAWALSCGLSLAHHRTMLLLAPAYALLVWTTDRRLVRDRGRVLYLALLFLAPLSLYLLLPLFSALNPPYAYQRIDSARAFFDLVLARAYQGSLFQGGWRGLGPRLAEGGRLLARQFGWPGLAVALLGWAAIGRRDRRVAGALLLGMAAQFLFALNYYVPNTYVYYLPVYAWLALCAAAGIDAALRAARVATRSRRSAGAANLCAHVTLACVLLAAAWGVHLASTRWAGMDQGRAYRQQPFDDDYGRTAARSVDTLRSGKAPRPAEASALIVADWMPATVLWYVQYVEGWMPGVQVTVADPLEGLWQGPVEAALAAGRPVYLARPVMGVSDRYALSSAGPLVRVLDERRLSAPALSHPMAGEGQAEIALLGADLSPTGAGAGLAAGDTLHVTLYWQARGAPEGDAAVRVRLVDASGYAWLEQHNRHPVGGTYPTSRWQAGEVVADAYALDLPATLGAGAYRLQAALGAPGTDPAWATVAALELGAAPGGQPPLGRQVRKAFGGGWVLTGYDAPPEWVAGETASLALQWLACPRSDPGAHPQAWLVSRGGTARTLEPVAASHADGVQSIQWFRFTVGDDLARVELRGPAPHGLGQARFRLPVPVSDAPPGVNFDNKLRLRDATYRADAYRPGETVQLSLEWEAMRAMDEAYKVFVHVLGPDGLPVAQQDNEPLNGTYPTTRWQPGERVSDPYAIALPAGLPPGEYPVEVGLYRLSDFTRLPVLDAGQKVVDDKLYLEPLTVR